MLVTDAIADVLVRGGADTVFGVVGSGNFHVTNALTARGARFIAARHEGGAATMADAWARTTGRAGLLSVHQGPGFTNALTGITEAAKSRTPLVVLAADVAGAAVRSNFRIGVAALATAVGAVPERVHSPGSAVADTARALRTAQRERRTVVLALPLDVQAAECEPPGPPTAAAPPLRPQPDLTPMPAPAAVEALAAALERAERPVFIAGRGARIAQARADLELLADTSGALLSTSAAAKGLFRGSSWDLDVSGGFASPLAAELIRGADLIVGWGCALSMWTTRHGTLAGPGARVAQVDCEAGALGAHLPVDLGVLGDVAGTARAVAAVLGDRRRAGYRSGELRELIAARIRWRDVPYSDDGDWEHIDPRTLSIALDDMLPEQRLVAVDSGNFMGYPSMYLSVPDADGFCFTQAYQSIGLGLASAIGAALAQPARLPVAALGDGGALMAASELETVVRLGLPMLIVVYDDEAYGAEVHHFRPGGHPLHTVTFPPVDIASIGRGFGCEGVIVRRPDDLRPVKSWLDGGRHRPLLIDAKVVSARPSWWLEEAFRGH
jgi:thiamine pyrophosphate-dependent acetolactate synthase large subunit-like protein